MLNNNSSTPLYKQLVEIISKKIQDETYPPGSQIPTENKLREQYQVSRVTVRQALQELAEKGIIERKTGKGTFVTEEKLMRKLSSVMSFTDVCRLQGHTPGAKTIRIDLITPNENDQKRMQLNSEENILLIERIRYADEVPVLLERTKFPESFFYLMDENITDTSLYEILKKHGTVVSHSFKTLDITFATYKESKYLHITKGHPLLKISSIVTSESDNSIHLSEQLCVADKFKLVI